MIDLLRTLFAALAVFAAVGMSPAAAQSQWDGVARVVTIGDLHGDYDKFVDMMNTAGLIDAHGDWIGGQTHLVQVGDVPDRGADTRKILDHLARLEPQAQHAGGYVHALIGNHEGMNLEGDLRYVVAGEYAAFADRQSARRRDAYYKQTVRVLRAAPPATGLPEFDDAFRAQWNSEHPLGYVEHRIAWSPQGQYGKWVSGHDAIIRINDTLYMHAGLGPAFLAAERDPINDGVRAALKGAPVAAFADILTNEQGPLWYRGLALNDELTEKAQLDALLAKHSVARIVVGHTKRASMVFPRFDGRVILTDIAAPANFADPHAFLIQDGGELTAVYRGQRVPLRAATQPERCAYMGTVAALDPPNGPNARLAANCAAPLAAAVAQPEN